MIDPPTAPAPSAAPDDSAFATHPCLRCGSPIALTEALCRACNPGDLKQPAASQVHGTVFLGIALAVALMVIAGFLFIGGVGPFSAQVTGAQPEADGLRLSVQVSNDGSRDGPASCRVWDPSYLGAPPRETFIRTPPVPARGSLSFEQVVTALGTRPGSFAIECSR